MVIVSSQGLTMFEWLNVKDSLKKANLEQLIFMLSMVEDEIQNRRLQY